MRGTVSTEQQKSFQKPETCSKHVYVGLQRINQVASIIDCHKPKLNIVHSPQVEKHKSNL